MQIHGVEIADTFAEAFGMTAGRLIVTAATREWAAMAVGTATGYGTSVLGCDCETGIERMLEASDTPDGRPGAAMLAFAFSRESLEQALVNRTGQCLLTCPTTSVFNGLPIADERSIRVGGGLRYFGDGWQISKLLDGRRFWRVPVMDGEFLCEDRFGTVKGIAGGNFLILGKTQAAALAAASAAVQAIQAAQLEVILPFPGGIVRSGSKVGSKYPTLRASTNEAFCPTLRGVVPSQLPAGVNACYEIVIDGLSRQAVERAMAAGIRAACVPGVRQITAGNYGGKLGPHHFHLHQLLA